MDEKPTVTVTPDGEMAIVTVRVHAKAIITEMARLRGLKRDEQEVKDRGTNQVIVDAMSVLTKSSSHLVAGIQSRVTSEKHAASTGDAPLGGM